MIPLTQLDQLIYCPWMRWWFIVCFTVIHFS